jgi:ABC-2 type transport system permease protein
MTRLLRAELLKLRTVWSTWVLLGVAAVLTGALGAVIGFVPRNRHDVSVVFPARGSAGWYDVVFSVMTLSIDLALVLGVIMITGENRHKTITSTFLAEPRRGRVATSKLVVALGAGLVVAVVAGVVGLGFGSATVAAGMAPAGRMLSEFRHVWPGVAAASVLFAAYGVGLGALLKNQVVALVVGIGATAVVEPIVVAAAPSVGRWLPSEAAQALESVTARPEVRGAFGSGLTHLVTWWEGGLVLLAYGVVLAAAGSFTTLRADVT